MPKAHSVMGGSEHRSPRQRLLNSRGNLGGRSEYVRGKQNQEFLKFWPLFGEMGPEFQENPEFPDPIRLPGESLLMSVSGRGRHRRHDLRRSSCARPRGNHAAPELHATR